MLSHRQAAAPALAASLEFWNVLEGRVAKNGKLK